MNIKLISFSIAVVTILAIGIASADKPAIYTSSVSSICSAAAQKYLMGMKEFDSKSIQLDSIVDALENDRPRPSTIAVTFSHHISGKPERCYGAFVELIMEKSGSECSVEKIYRKSIGDCRDEP